MKRRCNIKSSHWADFIPANSGVDNFFGGINPEQGYAEMNAENGFCAVTYRLNVAAAQNGYHHFLGMYTSVQGVAFSNACLKEDCRPGIYQFTAHFNLPKPLISAFGNAAHFLANSYQASLFFGQDADDYGTANRWTGILGGLAMDIMVLRPTLVDPTNINNRVDLWDPSVYDGWQMFFTGIPLADPNIIDGSIYEL